MEIPDIHLISDFEASLQNPSLIYRFFSFPGFEKVSQAYSFWKWTALIFAIFATFATIIRRINLILISFRTRKPSSHKKEEIIEFDEDDEISLASSDDDEQEQNENRGMASSRGQHRVDEDSRVKGTTGLFRGQRSNGDSQQRQRLSYSAAWSEFTSGKSVVKLWDRLGLSLDFDEDLFNYGSQGVVVSTWDYDRDLKKSGFNGGIWNIPAAPAGVLLMAEGNRKGSGLILGGYDTRISRRVPAVYAEWSSPAAAEKVVEVAKGSIGKVFVRNDISGVLTVGDMRNVRRPLETVTESDGDTWWDADAVIVENE